MDPMALVAATRPGPAIDIGTPEPGSIRRSRRDTPTEDHQGNRRNLSELDTSPASPSYRSKIPPPPCAACAADHQPGHVYDHEYVRPMDDAPMAVLNGVPVPVNQVPVAPNALPAAQPATKRMTLFPGKTEGAYLLVVEERTADDWEDCDGGQFVLANTVLSRVLPIFDLLGLKIKDRTGGDLVMLRNPDDDAG